MLHTFGVTSEFWIGSPHSFSAGCNNLSVTMLPILTQHSSENCFFNGCPRTSVWSSPPLKFNNSRLKLYDWPISSPHSPYAPNNEAVVLRDTHDRDGPDQIAPPTLLTLNHNNYRTPSHTVGITLSLVKLPRNARSPATEAGLSRRLVSPAKFQVASSF